LEKIGGYFKTRIIETTTKGLRKDVNLKPVKSVWIKGVPEHWKVKKIKRLTKVFRGKFTHRPRNDERLYDGEFPFIQTGSVTNAKKYINEYHQTLNEWGKSVNLYYLFIALRQDFLGTAIIKKKKHEIVRSSAAEYLTFIAAHGDGGIEAVYADENIWLTQKMMGTLYSIATHTINYHLKKIFTDSELQEDSVIRDFRITASDGKIYNTKHYNLSAIIAVGYKVNSERAVQFRKWATGIIQEFTIKGFTMDDERLKNDGTILGKKYFEEQLQRIREIRLSERKFYQKITDIYITAIDYDVNSQATKRFFATVQNKLHWAIHGQTAAELDSKPSQPCYK
jgi:hypothetical protein